jgi:hypothetical protein
LINVKTLQLPALASIACIGLSVSAQAAPSPNGTRVPRDAAQITDSAGHVWRLNANALCPSGAREILRDNARPVATYATCGNVILFFNGSVSIMGDDNLWYGWLESGRIWMSIGEAPDANAPPRSPAPSPSGTMVPRDATRITDSAGHVWRLNANAVCPSAIKEILRDNARPVASYVTCGSLILFFNGSVSILGDDNLWYGWLESSRAWTLIGASASDSGVPTPTHSARLFFTPSSDDSITVTSYRLDVFSEGAYPATATPVQAQNVGKPPMFNGERVIDLMPVLSTLSPGSYFCTVTAIGPGGSSRSEPSEVFAIR